MARKDAVGLVIGLGPKGKDEGYEDEVSDEPMAEEGSDEELGAAEELIDAVKSGDPQSVVDAVRALVGIIKDVPAED